MHLLYITSPSKDEALKISSSLISNKFAACCNILEGATSVYEWEGEIKQESEVIIIAKTSSNIVENAIEHIKSIHPYECPCIVAVNIDNSNHDFSKWVEEATNQ